MGKNKALELTMVLWLAISHSVVSDFSEREKNFNPNCFSLQLLNKFCMYNVLSYTHSFRSNNFRANGKQSSSISKGVTYGDF